jgi:Zn-dependent metalloprotease
MVRASGGGLSITTSKQTGLVSFVRGLGRRAIPSGEVASAPAERRALRFLAAHGGAFGLPDVSHVGSPQVQKDAEVGMDHVRLRQIYKGLPVTGGEVGIHLRGADVVAVHARTLPVPEPFNTSPAVSAGRAEAEARALLQKHDNVADATLSTPRLEIFNRGLLEGTAHPTRLAWFIEAKKVDLREFIWVDAEDASILLSFSQLADALNRRVYDAQSTSALPGVLVRSEGGAPTGDADADLAYQFSGDTYNYFAVEHGRDSYDGAGASMISTVHYCPDPSSCPFSNALWNGSQTIYGTGWAVDDVVAHEFAHAVMDHTANLFYYMQSGALNESFSDIFGETIDLTNGSANDTPAVRWVIAEELGGIRNMANPNAFGDPAKMSDAAFFACLDSFASDRGGVHINSGVPNRAYALMVDGGTFNGFTVTGLGLTKSGKIQYRALTQYLLSASDFLDDYNALQQACSDLIGVSGITAADCAEVKNALDAVEMASPWPCFSAQADVPDPCEFGETPVNLFFDDFEAGSSNWQVVTLTGNDLWFLDGSFATSGLLHLRGLDATGIADSRIEMKLDIAIPDQGARMHFNHSYGFENSPTIYYDGGVVEYSTDAGASWSDAGPLISAGATYVAPIDTCCSNPLATRNAFVGDSFGYSASRLDLSSLAGENVRFRFRIGTDPAVTDAGWFIDDVRIYQCISPCPTSPATGCSSPGKSSLVIKDRDPVGPSKNDRLIWKWLRGAAVEQADLGDPINGDTDYQFCLYDGAGLAASIAVPGGSCPGDVCWEAGNRGGYKYKDKSASRSGAFKLGLQPGAAGRSKITFTAKGANLPTPALPLDASGSVTLQLHTSDSASCWEAVFPGPTVENDPALFKGAIP